MTFPIDPSKIGALDPEEFLRRAREVIEASATIDHDVRAERARLYQLTWELLADTDTSREDSLLSALHSITQAALSPELRREIRDDMQYTVDEEDLTPEARQIGEWQLHAVDTALLLVEPVQVAG